jgi:predicted nucleic acid-binding protein
VIVADASAVLEFLLGGSRGRVVEEHFLAESDDIQVPALLDVEVAQVLRRMVAMGLTEEARARASLEILGEMPLHRHLLNPLLPRIWELRSNLTAYDAAYVALAEALACPLITYDGKLGRAPSHTAKIITLGTG